MSIEYNNVKYSVKEQADLVYRYAVNYKSRKLICEDDQVLSVVVHYAQNESQGSRTDGEFLEARLVKAKASMARAYQAIEHKLTNVSLVKEIYACFHDMQTVECKSFEKRNRPADTVHNDHIHIGVVYTRAYTGVITDNRWFKAFKSSLLVEIPNCTIFTMRMFVQTRALMYLLYKHKNPVLSKVKFEHTFENPLTRTSKTGSVMSILMRQTTQAELAYLYHNSQAKRAIAAGDKHSKGEIMQMLTDVIVDYGVRSFSDLGKRVLNEVTEDDRLEVFKSMLVNYGGPIAKTYLGQALDLAFTQVQNTTLQQFGDKYLKKFGEAARNGVLVNHASLAQSRPLFKAYCEKSLNTTVPLFLTKIHGWFDRSGVDRKKNTLAFISETSHGKSWLVRSLAYLCPLHTNNSEDGDDDKFKFQDLQHARFAVFNELKIDNANVNSLKAVYEGAEVQVPVKHHQRASLHGIPVLHTSNHRVDKDLALGADIRAMRSRCHIFHPKFVDELVNCPNLHPAIFTHYRVDTLTRQCSQVVESDEFAWIQCRDNLLALSRIFNGLNEDSVQAAIEQTANQEGTLLYTEQLDARLLAIDKQDKDIDLDSSAALFDEGTFSDDDRSTISASVGSPSPPPNQNVKIESELKNAGNNRLSLN